MKRAPEHLEEIGSYSNFDNCMEPNDLEAKVRSGDGYAAHPARNHWGKIWFEGGEFHEEVKRYHKHIATVSGKSMKLVFKAVNDQFGWD